MSKSDVQRLIIVCKDIVTSPELQPEKDKSGNVIETHCNIATHRIVNIIAGYNGFNGLTANEIVSKMEKEWKPIFPERATEIALEGGIAVVGRKFDTHGHVAVVFPMPMMYSESYGKDVPIIANCGKVNGILKVSQCFRFEDEPLYFTL